MAGSLETIFVRDAQTFLGSLDSLLARFEAGTATSDTLDEAFRIMHSIKSEATHLDKREIAEAAHRAETALAALREDVTDSSQINQLFIASSSLQELLRLEPPSAGQRLPRKRDEKASNFHDADSGTSAAPLFSSFELILLAESRDRGENLYRMVCDFDPETEMKYPKAVLILNNLEQQVNVIKTVPDLETPFSGDQNAVAFYFSTKSRESELFNAVSIDQVRRVFLSRLAWEQHLPSDKALIAEAPAAGIQETTLRRDQLALLWSNMLRGKIALQKRKDRRDEAAAAEMHRAIEGIGSVLQASRYRSFGALFADLPALALSTAREQNKEVRCDLEGEELLLEHHLGSLLRDSLVQIVRNAVSHGIEEREVRLKAGKSPRGEIRIRYTRDEKELSISVDDDGQGIDEEVIRARAAQLGLDSTGSLLSILTFAGFSISDDATVHAGRGIGLDIASTAVNKIPGARMDLALPTGQGAVFTLRVPLVQAGLTLLFLKQQERVVAVEKRRVEESETAKQTLFSRDEDGRVRYRGLPVLTCDGYLFWVDGFPDQDTLLLMRRERAPERAPKITQEEERFYLLVEEILFEEQLPPEFVRSRRIDMSPHKRLMIGEQDTGIDFLENSGLVAFHSAGTAAS